MVLVNDVLSPEQATASAAGAHISARRLAARRFRATVLMSHPYCY
jgi:hypothetical protein